MIEISIDWIRIKRFRSFTDETFKFPQTQGLRLLGGDNQEQPRLGANGVGKTSLLDAICWNWYGRSIKGGKTSDLISWGQKDTEVTASVKVGDRTHIIRRYGPPMRIELDGQPVDQPAIDNFLKLSYKRFLHSVIFGQAVSLFPDLSVPERGELFDEVLNLKVWTECTDAASAAARDLDTLLFNEQKNTSYLEGQLSQLETDEQVQRRIDSWEQNKQQELQRFIKMSKDWDTDHLTIITGIKEHLDVWEEKRNEYVENCIQEVDKLERRSHEILTEQMMFEDNAPRIADVRNKLQLAREDWKRYSKEKTEAEARRKFITKPLSFWEQNAQCPTCGKPIEPHEKQKHIMDIETEERELLRQISILGEESKDAEEATRQLDDFLREMEIAKATQDEKARALQNEWNTITARMNQIEQDLSKTPENPYIQQLKEAENEDNPYQSEIVHIDEEQCPILQELEQLRNRRHDLEVQIAEKQSSIRSIQSRQVAVDYWKQGFKRIRLYFVNQILAALELEIQSAISQLGLEGWRVKLSTESETKSGTVKLGIAIRIYSPKAEGAWEVWSGGESQRLRLAIALGLSSLIQRAAGVWFKTCIFDEPTTWLSTEGIEDLIEALQGFAEGQNKAVWLLDHRALFHGGFSEVWNVVKQPEGAKIVRMR